MSNPSFTLLHAARVAAALLSLTAPALAGPLDPPPGPVAPTHKTLTDVEPRIPINAANTPGDATCTFKITQPGSYYLTGNLSGVAGKNGIVITARDVTVDLNGFTLYGLNTSACGIITSGINLDNVTVQNGDVVHWGQAGIDLVTGSPLRSTVRNVRSTNNISQGIRVYNDSRVIDCVTDFNGGVGIDGYSHIIVTRCQASNNTDTGIDLSAECLVSDCLLFANDGRGLTVGDHSVVSSCSAASNFRSGITVHGRSIVTGNNACNNGQDGFSGGISITGSDTRVEGNNCISNARGMDIAGPGNIIMRNSCSGNTINWNIVPGNAVAPISAPPTNGSLISGNLYTGSLGSADANANFTY